MAKKQAAAKKPAAKKTETKKAAPKKAAVKLDPAKMYDFIVTKDSKHMKKGTYIVDGATAQILTDKGIGSAEA